MQRMETQFYLLTDKVMRFNKILLIMLKERRDDKKWAQKR